MKAPTSTLVLLAIIALQAFVAALPKAEEDFLKACIDEWAQPPPTWVATDIADACSWEGITCVKVGSPLDDTITQIKLTNYVLGGSLPPSIGALQHLTTLHVWHAGLMGNIPPQIGALKELHFINLCCNELEGEIPNSLGNLTQLRFMRLHSNRLTGEIPESIGTMPSLEVLILERNLLSGKLPQSFMQLQHLHWLDVRTNPLAGCPPTALNPTLVFCGLEDTNIQCGDDCGNLALPKHCEVQCERNKGHVVQFDTPDTAHTTAPPNITTQEPPSQDTATPAADTMVKKSQLILPYSLAAAGGVLLLVVLGVLVYVIRRRQVASEYAALNASFSDYDDSEGSVTDPDWDYESDSWDEFEGEDDVESDE